MEFQNGQKRFGMSFSVDKLCQYWLNYAFNNNKALFDNVFK